MTIMTERMIQQNPPAHLLIHEKAGSLTFLQFTTFECICRSTFVKGQISSSWQNMEFLPVTLAEG